MALITKGSWTRPSDGKVFRIGQRVRGWSSLGSIGKTKEGYTGTVVHFDPDWSVSHGAIVQLRLFGLNPYGYPEGRLVSVWCKGLEPLAAPLTIDSRLTCRDPSIKVLSVSATGDKDRPIGATVRVQGRELALTYPEHGQFYEGFEQAIDLIGAQ